MSRPLENDEDMLDHIHEVKVEETMNIVFGLSESSTLKSLILGNKTMRVSVAGQLLLSASDLRDTLLDTMLPTSFYFLFMFGIFQVDERAPQGIRRLAVCLMHYLALKVVGCARVSSKYKSHKFRVATLNVYDV